MTNVAISALLCLTSTIGMAAQVSCPDVAEIGGTYQTEVGSGFKPKVLSIAGSTSGPTQWVLSLRSNWSGAPHNDGTHETIGDFAGPLVTPTPWSCTALFSRMDMDTNDQTVNGECSLVLRFIGADVLYVEELGACVVSYGHRANPSGQYHRVK